MLSSQRCLRQSTKFFESFVAAHRIENGSLIAFCRHSSSSSKRWVARQGKDKFAREARVQGLKSRAAYKLLEVCFHCSRGGEISLIRYHGRLMKDIRYSRGGKP